jgi:hypothetical protein
MAPLAKTASAAANGGVMAHAGGRQAYGSVKALISDERRSELSRRFILHRLPTQRLGDRWAGHNAVASGVDERRCSRKHLACSRRRRHGGSGALSASARHSGRTVSSFSALSGHHFSAASKVYIAWRDAFASPSSAVPLAA